MKYFNKNTVVAVAVRKIRSLYVVQKYISKKNENLYEKYRNIYKKIV